MIMIDEKKIKEASKAYYRKTQAKCSEIRDDEFEATGKDPGLFYVCADVSFMNGAKWMQKKFIEQLWHSPTIVPENYKDIILISQKGLVHQWYFNPKIDWYEDTKNYNIERWCYIDDILPKVEEE